MTLKDFLYKATKNTMFIIWTNHMATASYKMDWTETWKYARDRNLLEKKFENFSISCIERNTIDIYM